MSLEHPIKQDIELNNTDLLDELNYLMIIKKNYKEYLKEGWDKKKKSKKIQPYVLEINNKGDSVQIEGYKLKIIEEKNNKTDSLSLIVHYRDKPIYEKKIIIPKTIHLKDAIEHIDDKINKENIVNKLKSLIDRINNIDKIEFSLESEHTDTLIDMYKKEYILLKTHYKDLLKSRNLLITLKNKLIVNTDKYINRLTNYSNYYEYQSTNKYIEIINNPSIKKNYTDYFNLLEIIESKLEFNTDETDYIEYFDKETNSSNIASIIKQTDSELEIKPYLSKTHVLITSKDILSTNITPGIKEVSNYLNKNLNKLLLINYNDILHKLGETMITPKIEIKKYFTGTIIKNTLHTDIDVDIETEPETEPSTTPTLVKSLQRTINNEDDYSGDISLNLLYNTSNKSYLTIDYTLSSLEPGKELGEYISDNAVLDSIFINLNKYSDWRIKLDDFYINKRIVNKSNIIAPIIINNKCFSSVLHYFTFSKFDSRQDIGGHKKLQYQKFANSLLLDENGVLSRDGINSKIWGKKLLEIIDNYDFSLPPYWNSIKDSVIKRGLYAKYYQNTDIKTILLDTQDAVLLKLVSKKKFTFTIDYELMTIRYLIKNEQDPSKFYKNYIEDKAKYDKLVSNPSVVQEVKPTVKEVKPTVNIDEPSKLYTEEDEVELFGNDDIVSLFNILEKKIKTNKLSIVDLPITEESLYYSAVHGLYNLKLDPMLFSNSNSYSSSIVFKNVRDSEEFYQPIFVDAAEQLRTNLTEFIKLNLLHEPLHEKLQHIKDTMSESGISGGDILIALSAMVNINITIYNTEQLSPSNILVSDSKKIFKIPSDFNKGEPKTLLLGFLIDDYYTLLLKQSEYTVTQWDKRLYYIVTIHYNGTDYDIASYYNSDSLIVVGIFNTTSKKWDSTGNDELDETLGQLMSSYWSENSNDPNINKDIKTEMYWNNTTTNEIFHEHYKLESVGNLMTDRDESGAIEYYIEFK